MQKRKLFWVTGFSAILLAASILLLPQLRDGIDRSSGNALARTSAKAPVPVVTAIAENEVFTETLEALGTAKANPDRRHVITTAVEHPAVLECVVVGVPDERWSEVPKAIVALRAGSAATEPERPWLFYPDGHDWRWRDYGAAARMAAGSA